jgi:hypothetical protein
MRDFRPEEVPACLRAYFEEVVPSSDGKDYVSHPT